MIDAIQNTFGHTMSEARDNFVAVLAAVEYTFDHLKSAWDIAANQVALVGLGMFEDLKHLFGTLIPSVFVNFATATDPEWHKMNWIVRALTDYEWVWWQDADVFCTSFTSIDDLPAKSSKPLIFTRDSNGLNAGSFLVRNDPESRRFLGSVVSLWPEYKDHKWKEQGAIHSIEGEFADHIQYIDQREINSYVDNWQKGDRVVHFAGQNPDRLERMKKWMEANA